MARAEFHDHGVRSVKSQRVRCDEIWSFLLAKAKNVPTAKRHRKARRHLDLDGA